MRIRRSGLNPGCFDNDVNLLVMLMMYWAAVYILVVAGVAIPFILLYIVAGAVWLSFQTMSFIAHKLRGALAVRKWFVNVHWSTMHR